jgi:CHAT domain-containing protein
MPLSRRTGWVALAVAIVAAFAMASILLFGRIDATSRLLRSAASSPERPIEGRLTGVSYAPRKGTIPESDLASLHAVAAAFLSEHDREPHASAVALLLYGKPAEAVDQLERLTKLHANDPNVWSDLAAARLQAGSVLNDPRTVALALVASNRALELQPAHEAALFNRALALDALGLRFASADAWRLYVAADPGSAWSNEARQRQAAADQPTREVLWKQDRIRLEQAADRGDQQEVERVVACFPQQSRGTGESLNLGAWGNAYVAGQTSEATRLLARVRMIAIALQKANGDSLLAETMRAIDAADEGSLKQTAVGARAYGKARDDLAHRRLAEALREFTEAERAFATVHNPMELVASYYRGNVLATLGDAQTAEKIAARLEPRIEPGFRSLRAHVLWLRGQLTTDAGRHYDAFVAIRNAREAFERLGEIDNADRLRTGEAGMLARLGREREAWDFGRLALAGAAASGRWDLVETSIEGIAREEVDGPDRDIARALFDVQVHAPSALPLMRFNGLLWLAYLDEQTTDRRPDTSAARAAAAKIPDPKQRADAIDDLRLAEALTAKNNDPASAEQMMGEVIDYRTRVGLLPYLPAIYVQRAHLRRTLARPAEAEQDLRAAIELIESRRGGIQDNRSRDAFLGRSADAYEELGDLLLARGDWKGAFEISERARARVLLDRVERDPMSLADIVAATPITIVGAHYTTFATHTLLVVIERGQAIHYVIDVSRTELADLRDRLVKDPESVPVSRRLYNLLIAPLHDRLAPDRVLIIAPDDTTYGIPFAALREPGGRFLIEETTVALAPAGAAIAAEPPLLVPSRAKIAVIADPAFSPALFPHLERLPEARDDAKTLTSQFAQTTSLVAESATRRAFAAAAEDSDAVHIAAHAFSSRRDASLSLIALAPEQGDAGLLYLQDIEALRLDHHPLVVLAGCETGAFGGGNGSIRSLAHAFLGAGSRAVLATLWNVQDDRTSELTKNFYRHLAVGATLPAALREAQLAAIRSQEGVDWAAFQLHVGVAGNSQVSTSH